MKKIECTNKDCLFLHKVADPCDIISREDLNGNKNIFMEQQLYAIKIAEVFNVEVRKKLQSAKMYCSKICFPSVTSIYQKDIVKEQDPTLMTKNKLSLSHSNTYTNANSKKNFSEDERENIKKDLIGVGGKLSNVLTPKNKIQHLISENTSTSSKEDIHYTHQEDKLSLIPHKLFQNRENSRFFTKHIDYDNKNSNNNTEINSSIEVPAFIQSILTKRASTFILSKAMKHLEDLSYQDKELQNEFKNRNDWAEFIIKNKKESQIDYDKQLIEDFDYINNLVLDKCSKYK